MCYDAKTLLLLVCFSFEMGFGVAKTFSIIMSLFRGFGTSSLLFVLLLLLLLLSFSVVLWPTREAVAAAARLLKPTSPDASRSDLCCICCCCCCCCCFSVCSSLFVACLSASFSSAF